MEPKIVIIGAGASGIAAGTKLLELGFRNVLLLEAENRFGGRIYTVPAGANVLDIGAQWCHGEKDNVVYKLANGHNLFDSSSSQYNKFDCVRSNKEYIPTYLTDRLTNIIKETLDSAHHDLQSSRNISLGTYLCKKYEEALSKPENSHIDRELAVQYLEMYQKYENSVESSDTLFDVSGNGYLQYWECEGDMLLNWKNKGFITVLHLLMGTFPDGNSGKNILEKRILFNKKVQEIVWDIRENGKSLIKCTDGDYIEADHIICTVSLGVLKECHTKLFSPALPIGKIRAIEGLEIGTVDKLFIEFAEPFWPKNWIGFNLIWTKEDIQNIRRCKDNWLEDVFGFYMVDYQPNVLCGWISGVNARRMEMVSEEDVLSGLMYLLRKFLVWDVPEPKAFKRSTWYTNPNFRGSYSFRSMKSDQLNTSAADLAQPLTKKSGGSPVLLFAGEATHDHYYSTVHGAIETGWREAHRLGNLYSSEKNSDQKSSSMANIYDVVVIGCGLAGLGAGRTLRNANVKLVILEGQDYIGGRVKSKHIKSVSSNVTTDSNSDYIDVGAQWLHGEQNALYKIANSNKLLTSDLSEEGLGSYIREDGYKFDEFFHKKIDFIVGTILAECENFSTATTEKYPKSLLHYLDEKFKIQIDKFSTDDEKKRAMQIFDWHKRFQIIDNSCLNLNQVSAKYWGLYSFNGESCQAHINFKNGFSSIIGPIVKDIGAKNIKLNANVIEIDWNVENNDRKLVTVRTACGQKYLARHVLVTCSLGVLKGQHEKLFRPMLPKKIQTAINQIGFETINKIFLQFDNPWWRPMEGIQLIFNSDSDYENAKWTRYLSGFDILNPGLPNTLVGWVGSYGAIEMEKLTDAEIVKDCVEILSKFTKCKIPYPIKFECSRWGSNPFIKGGYSYISTKCDESCFNGATLSKPITISDLLLPKNNKVPTSFNKLSIKNCEKTNDDEILSKHNDNESRPILLFAGEACHQKYFSTAHGAFLSGIEQAQTILKYL